MVVNIGILRSFQRCSTLIHREAVTSKSDFKVINKRYGYFGYTIVNLTFVKLI